MTHRSHLPLRRLAGLLAFGFAFASAIPLRAQPFGDWMVLTGASAYVEIPDSAALNPTSAFTVEAWVAVTDSGSCSSIVGKGFATAWWVGICGTTLRSFLKGTTSLHDGGTLDSNWNHIAVTFDGTNRRHYINGELVATFPETGPLPTNTTPVRIGSDVDYARTPAGSIDEVRLWNVARTTDEIRGSINAPISAATAGLVAVWSLDGTTDDALGVHNGSPVGPIGFLNGAIALSCSPTATQLCFDGRFAVTAQFLLPDGTHGVGMVVPGASTNSGLFWFLTPDNWELLVKELDGCALNSRRWIFSAATTNVHYRLNVYDVTHGIARVYFNYQGVSAPAITDTEALAVCP